MEAVLIWVFDKFGRSVSHTPVITIQGRMRYAPTIIQINTNGRMRRGVCDTPLRVKISKKIYKMNQQKDRQSIRLQGYDYSQDGWYFITICVNGFQEFFGEIKEGKFITSKWGEVVENCWNETVELRKGDVSIDFFQIMPNHFHAIIIIGDKNKPPMIAGFPDTKSEKSIFKSPSKTVGAIARGFKSSVTSKIQKLENVDDLRLWQRNYYERIIRDEQELYRIRKYIQRNPKKMARR